jgi:hypothetical protein
MAGSNSGRRSEEDPLLSPARRGSVQADADVEVVEDGAESAAKKKSSLVTTLTIAVIVTAVFNRFVFYIYFTWLGVVLGMFVECTHPTVFEYARVPPLCACAARWLSPFLPHDLRCPHITHFCCSAFHHPISCCVVSFNIVCV